MSLQFTEDEHLEFQMRRYEELRSAEYAESYRQMMDTIGPEQEGSTRTDGVMSARLHPHPHSHHATIFCSNVALRLALLTFCFFFLLCDRALYIDWHSEKTLPI